MYCYVTYPLIIYTAGNINWYGGVHVENPLPFGSKVTKSEGLTKWSKLSFKCFCGHFCFFPWTAWKDSQQWYQMDSWIIPFKLFFFSLRKITCSNHSFFGENFLLNDPYYTDMTSSNPSRRKSWLFSPFVLDLHFRHFGGIAGEPPFGPVQAEPAHDGSENLDHRSALVTMG